MTHPPQSFARDEQKQHAVDIDNGALWPICGNAVEKSYEHAGEKREAAVASRKDSVRNGERASTLQTSMPAVKAVASFNQRR
jgi:hypothetical protein